MGRKRGENYNPRELRISGVPRKTKEEIENIAAHIGGTVAGLLKPKLQEIVNSFPEHMKKPMPE